jgi:predicted molibdopterin-dependent oxidoreductase YjgC
MGAYATALPGGLPVTPENAATLAGAYGFPVRGEPGLSAEEMVEAAGEGRIEVLYSSGGNFLEVLPDPHAVEAALATVPLRVHQDIVVSTQMLVDPADTVVLLPAATRYEQRDGGTQTTTERRILFSPEIPGSRVGEARSEWEIFVDLARRVDPSRVGLMHFASGSAIREEIARVVPSYAGVERLRQTGDQVQWGGERLCEGPDGPQFATADGKARFTPVRPPVREPTDGLRLSTRRGKQFNTMVHNEIDPLTGAARDSVFVSDADADRLGLADGAPVLVRSDHGELRALVHRAPLRPGNVQVFYPEGNVLLPGGRRDRSGVPDYNTTVELVPQA